VVLPIEPVSHGATEAFQQRARLAEDRLAEVLGAYRKLKSENEGYRDRITRNLERRFDQRRERLLLRFIEILDNLDRALEAAEVSYAGNPLIEGLILVRTQLLQTLQEEGLERIPVVGLAYDPGVSEAVETRPVDDPDQHHVVLRDLQRGYRLNGRVVRASKVVVGDYKAEGAMPSAPLETQQANPAPEKPKPAEPNPDDSLPPTDADKLLAEFEPLLDNLQPKDDDKS
jgi:molecular chaperone GrpE